MVVDSKTCVEPVLGRSFIWPCSSVGRATVIYSGGRGKGSEIFSPSPCGPISFLGLTLRRYYLGYLLEHFNLGQTKKYVFPVTVPTLIFYCCFGFFTIDSSRRKMFSVSSLFLLQLILKLTLLNVFLQRSHAVDNASAEIKLLAIENEGATSRDST